MKNKKIDPFKLLLSLSRKLSIAIILGLILTTVSQAAFCGVDFRINYPSSFGLTDSILLDDVDTNASIRIAEDLTSKGWSVDASYETIFIPIDSITIIPVRRANSITVSHPQLGSAIMKDNYVTSAARKTIQTYNLTAARYRPTLMVSIGGAKTHTDNFGNGLDAWQNSAHVR